MALPGNPRYQPLSLQPYFGYDCVARYLVEVELAVMDTLADMGTIPSQEMELLTSDVRQNLLAITMTEVDKREREVTHHDIRALVQIMQERMPEPLRRWVHVPLTSYDVLDTARALQYQRAMTQVVLPKLRQVVVCFRDMAIQYNSVPQIGRTHGQHALPITVGFWLATILNRVVNNATTLEVLVSRLVGKISGPVGAYNAQIQLGLATNTDFELRVLGKLGLMSGNISTQIVHPEPLVDCLFACAKISASLAQFGLDMRQLMRTEIAEVSEPFLVGQVGSSTMAHKRNPISFENIQGMWLRTKAEFSKVLDTLLSEHQRDLVGSSLIRDFPAIVINLVIQLETLLRPNKEGIPFLSRIVIDAEACARNLGKMGDVILAEPYYLLLQMYGYKGDAHELINHHAVPMIGFKAQTLFEAVEILVSNDTDLSKTWENIPQQIRAALRKPEGYIGLAVEQTRTICRLTNTFLQSSPIFAPL